MISVSQKCNEIKNNVVHYCALVNRINVADGFAVV